MRFAGRQTRQSDRGRSWRALTVLALLAGVLGGCSRRAEVAPPSAILRVSQRNEPTDLDPATASLPDEFFVIRAIGEGLLMPNPDGGPPLAGAAERFDVSSDGLTYTFHLRPDAVWSNGEPVTAGDFVASFRRVLTPATAAPKAHLFFAVRKARSFATGAISDFADVGFRAVDDRTLIIRLEHPSSSFPLYVASGAWIPVNPRVVVRNGRNWTDPAHHVGNGPFTLAEWRPHQRIVVVRNPRYHDAAHVQVGEIQFVRFDNQDSEERAFRAGQIDVTMAVPQSKLEVYAREHPEELHRAPLAETRFISFNVTRRPLNDERVRRALALAIDRQKITERVLRGGEIPATRFLSPALGTPVPEPARASGSHRTSHTYDPAEARRLLAEAGFPAGRNFPKLEFAGWVQNPVLEAIQEMWRQELGVDVRIVIQEAKVHLAALTSGSYDLAFVTTLLDVRDPVSALADFTRTAPNNFPHWNSSPFDLLIEQASTEQAPEIGRDLAAAETLLLSTAAVAPVYFKTQNWLMSPRVHGWEQDPLWSRRYNDVTVSR